MAYTWRGLFSEFYGINVKLAAEGGGGWWVGEAGHGLTFFKNLQSNSLPTGKSFQSNASRFPHPGLHIAVKYPKAGPKKGTIKISPNKTLQSLLIYITLLHHQRYIFLLQLQLYVLNINRVTLRRIQKPLGESPHSEFCKFKYTVLSQGTKKVSFISLQ